MGKEVGVVQWLSTCLAPAKLWVESQDLSTHFSRETQKASKHMRKSSEPLAIGEMQIKVIMKLLLHIQVGWL